MGIDVGDISIIGQIESPWSVNSLVQRLGRSGRRDGDVSVMKLFISENEPNENSTILNKIYTRKGVLYGSIKKFVQKRN